MRSVLILLAVLALVPFARAAEETKPLDEVQALKIKVLILEREVIQERATRMQLQAQEQFRRKAQELGAAIEAAAKDAGIDLTDGWQPDPDARTWKK